MGLKVIEVKKTKRTKATAASGLKGFFCQISIIVELFMKNIYSKVLAV